MFEFPASHAAGVESVNSQEWLESPETQAALEKLQEMREQATQEWKLYLVMAHILTQESGICPEHPKYEQYLWKSVFAKSHIKIRGLQKRFIFAAQFCFHGFE